MLTSDLHSGNCESFPDSQPLLCKSALGQEPNWSVLRLEDRANGMPFTVPQSILNDFIEHGLGPITVPGC